MAGLTITIPYTPRKHQLEVHRNLKRFNVLVCHRRFGKTVLAINELIRKALECQLEDPRYAYIAPTYKQAKTIAWDYLQKYSRPIPGMSYNQQELRADFPNKARIRLFGADNPDSLRGIYLDGVVPDEVAQMPPALWSQVVRPALADRKGWALFIGTPKGHNLFYDMYQLSQREPDWYGAVYRASETQIIPQEELAAARREGMSEEEFQQEFECSFEAAIIGAYYGREMALAESEGRIGEVPYDPSLPVETAWDLGIDDSTVIWFAQRSGQQLRIIDCHEGSGVSLAEYILVLQNKGYVYSRHIAPHDIEVKELGSGKSRKEIAASLGIRFEVAPKLPVQDGINAVRSILPKCWFNRKIGRGIEALKQYRREWNEKNGVFRSNPLHDWSSDYADAFRYLAVADKPAGKGVDYYKLYGM